MTPDSTSPDSTAIALEAQNLAREINERQERLESLKVRLRQAACAALREAGQAHGTWSPTLPEGAGSVLVAVPAPVVAVSKDYTPAHVRDRVGVDAYRTYFTEKVTLTLVPVAGFSERVAQEQGRDEDDRDLRDRLLSVVEVVHPTARVSLRPV